MLTLRSACRPLALALVVLASSPSTAAQASKLPSCVSRSWAGAVVIIPAAPQIWTQTPMMPGDTVAAMTSDGRCVGSVRWDGQGAALTVWMDDPTTERTDGLQEDEVFFLAVWNDHRIEELQSMMGPYWLQATFAYASYTSERSPWTGVTPDALFVVQSHRTQHSSAFKALVATDPALPDEVSLGAPFPNPARTLARVPVELPSPSEVAVDVFDIQGRRVGVPVRDQLEAGTHTVSLDVDALASGLYVIRLTAGDVVRQRQMVVVD